MKPLRLALAAVIALAIAPFALSSSANGVPGAPAGLTALAQNSQVTLAWQPVTGATEYRVFRGTSAGAISTQISPAGMTATSFADTSATNGTTYYYAVKAVASSGSSAASSTAAATPRQPSCTTGNAIVKENCFPGSTGWKATNVDLVKNGGIEGFAGATSINAGDSINLYVNTTDSAPYHIDIYRTGYYGGAQGRLISSLPGLTGVAQDACAKDANTGLTDCANWSPSATLTTTSAWTTGIYVAHLIRDDNGDDSQIIFVVRKDGDHAAIAYRLPDTTYQAYNNWGGKSVYDYNSSGDPTVAGTDRAVKVSFDRPYQQVYSNEKDWYAHADVSNVSWLEQQGYDIDYLSSVDPDRGTANLANHKIDLSAAHDEYWSQAERDQFTSARNAGTSLAFLGSNQIYWRIRFENSPTTNAPLRTMAVYKTTQSGATDPVSPTGTWRDPAGANQPENALIGSMYIGDNDGRFFPLKVTADEGQNRFWRHTDLANLAPGTTGSIGQYLVGWEWNQRFSNGLEPAGVTPLSSSPVTGEILTDAGKVYNPSASAVAESTVYTASSGALVWSTGTNHWSRGLAYNAFGVGEPNVAIQQATMNMLSDMGVQPTTPASGMVVDTPGAPSVTSRSPAPGATGVSSTAVVTIGFDRSLDPATVTSQNVKLTDSSGNAVPASVTYDDNNRQITLDPTSSLDSATSYTVTVGTGVKSWSEDALASAVTWTFTTLGGIPPSVTDRSPAASATGVATSTKVTATFDRALLASSVTTSSFKLTAPDGSTVPASVSYDSTSRKATLTPNSSLSSSTTYTATLSTAIEASDGTNMASAVTWSFTTAAPLTVTGRTPAPLASGISPATQVRATFSRAIDTSTLSASTFTLSSSSGSVPATVSYDPATQTAILQPSASLSLMTTYTATVSTGVKAADGESLGQAVSWTFTTATVAPPAPAPTTLTPAAGATGAPLDGAITAAFDRALDGYTVTGSSFQLTDSSGTVQAATVSYDSATQTAKLQPTGNLAPGATYNVRLTTAIRSSVGTPLAADVTWSFTAADCPCSMMPSSLTPVLTGQSVRDGRSGTGPWTYELGTKFTVSQDMSLTALRFYKDAGETGTHVGNVWSSTGALLASVTFSGESASGWQKQALTTPLSLTAGRTYVASVGFNTKFVATQFGLQSALTSGPLSSVADGANGVYNNVAGSFPTSSYRSTNYFVDVVVRRPSSTAPPPQLVSVTPLDGATGVGTSPTIKATFDSALDPATVNGSNVTLKTSGGTSVSASVSYDSSSRSITITPSASLSRSTTYVARIDTGVHSDEGTPLASAVSWSFSTAAAPVPVITSTSPTAGATGLGSATTVRATFSEPMDSSTLTSSTFSVTDSGGQPVAGTIAYDGPTRTATFTPSSPLASNAGYTATVTTGARSGEGAALASPVTWSFTTAACPCSLWPSTATPAQTGLATRDGRSGTGPWSYELGTKVQVTSGAQLTAIRFYKSSGETGTHVGRVWTSTGTLITSVTFSGETASGWQEQALPTPLTLSPGQTYVVSVGFNAFFSQTTSGLATQLTSGPLQSVADGANGVFASTAGVFPSSSYKSTSYFVGPVVR